MPKQTSLVDALAVNDITPLRGTAQRMVSLNGQQAKRINLCERLKHFTWAWFGMTMATGSLSVVLYMTPNQFDGLFTIGKIVFLFDLVAFCTFLVLIIARFIMVPSSLYQSLHRNPTESLFFGAFWVSIALLLQNIELYGQQYCGPWLTKALEICFWSYAAIVFCVGLFQYYTLFVEERLQINGMMPAWVLPIYPFLVAGPLAAVLIGSQSQSSGYKMWLGGVMFQGLGWMVSIFMYTIYTLRLMTGDLPEPPLRAGMFISVGPVCTSAFILFISIDSFLLTYLSAYTALAFVALGIRAQEVLPPDFLGSSLHAGEIFKVLGAIVSIFLWLLGFWFFCLSTIAGIAGFNRRGFTLTWWALVFPNSGLTLALIKIGVVLESSVIKGVTSGMTIFLVILWLGVLFSTVQAVWRKRILFPGKDEDLREKRQDLHVV